MLSIRFNSLVRCQSETRDGEYADSHERIVIARIQCIFWEFFFPSGQLLRVRMNTSTAEVRQTQRMAMFAKDIKLFSILYIAL